jgi:bifunctional DNase/RNase
MKGFEISVKQVVISDLHETTYLARIYLEQQRGDLRYIVEIDIRPTDSIILALMSNAPIYCSLEVLEKTIPFIE